MTAILDLGSFTAKIGAPTKEPAAVPIFTLRSNLMEPVLSKKPFSAFGAGMVYTDSQFEKIFSLAQLICGPAPNQDWANFAQKLSASAVAAT